MINLAPGFTILNLKSGSERPGDFYKSVEITCHDQLFGYANSRWSTVKIIQTPKIVHFSNSQSPARGSKSQLDQQLFLHKSYQINNKNE
jgi:hypothetical protein